MVYSALCMELASCGYMVITFSHNDRSSDYTPQAGHFDHKTPMYDYKTRNLQVKLRENEMLALVEEVMQPGFVGSVSLDWKNKVKLTSDLVILGHSFGGITALGAAKDCDAAKAVCVMDPWFWPKKDETFGAADH